jgi:hypothetical protein
LKEEGKCRERRKEKKILPHSLDKKQPFSFIDLPHHNHMVL